MNAKYCLSTNINNQWITVVESKTCNFVFQHKVIKITHHLLPWLLKFLLLIHFNSVHLKVGSPTFTKAIKKRYYDISQC